MDSNYMAKSMCDVAHWQSTLRRPGNGSQLSGNMVRIFSSERIQQKLQNGTGTAISVRESGVNRSFPSSIQVIQLALIILSRNTILTLKLASISLLKTAPRQR